MPDLRVFALIAILLFSGVAVASTSYSEHAYERQEISVDVNVTHDEWIELPGTELDNTTVTNASGGEVNEDDYELDEGGGRILFPSDGNAVEGDTLTVEYDARVPNDLAQSFAGDQSSMFGAAAMIAIVLAVSALLVAAISMTRSKRGWGWS